MQSQNEISGHGGQTDVPSVNVLQHLLRQSPFDALRGIVEQHGDFVRLQTGPTPPVYLTANADHFQYMLRDNHQNFKKSQVLYKGGKLVVGNGLITSSGDFWLRQRRMIQPHFHRRTVHGFVNTMAESIGNLLETWPEHGEIDLREKMAQLTIEVTSRIMFGTGGISPEEMSVISDDQLFIVDHVAMRGYLPFLPDWLPIPGTRRFQAAMGRISKTLNHIIELGRQGEIAQDSLLVMLINAVDEETNERMTNQQLFDEIMTIFIAGFETTSTALGWMFYLMEQHPNVKQQVAEEVGRVLGNQQPTLDTAMQLTYTREVFQETMRYYPPVPMLPRTADEDDHLGEYAIPAGSIVLLYFYGLHHNPKYWPHPEQFDPGRFAPENRDTRSQFTYLPFSSGPRKCIGNDFAMLEGVLIAAMVLQNYDIDVVLSDEIKPKLSTTLVPRENIMAHVARK